MIAGAAAGVSAHRLDEYLQSARIALEPTRVQIELDLTPGVAVANAVLTGIDGDRTGTISDDEAAAYAAIVAKAITLELDGAPLSVELVGRQFPRSDAFGNGEGSIRLELAAALPALPAGPHHLRYRNSHRGDIGVYLANVLVPVSDRVAVSAQQRDVDQRELIVDYTLRGGPSGISRGWLVAVITGVFVALAALWRHRRSTLPGR
jgi:hypothetical protein